jgi:hypothetical protein
MSNLLYLFLSLLNVCLGPSAAPELPQPAANPYQEDVWVQCDACQKWRRLPPSTELEDDVSWYDMGYYEGERWIVSACVIITYGLWLQANIGSDLIACNRQPETVPNCFLLS